MIGREPEACRCGECRELDRSHPSEGVQLSLIPAVVFDRYWRLRVRLGERHGQPLRVIERGAMNSALVEFDDGVRHVVSRNAFRRRSAGSC